MKGMLLPIVPRATEGEGQTGSPTSPQAVTYLLEKYGNRLADTVVCFEEDPGMVDTILKLGKKVVPAIFGDRQGGIFDWEHRTFFDQSRSWIRWVLENLNHFEAVMLGNCIVEVTNHFDQSEPTEQIIDRLCGKFPALVGRFALAPWHYDLLRDIKTLSHPIREALKRACPWIMVYWGYEMFGSPGLREYMREIPAWSGINFSTGAASHNLTGAISSGFRGCLFFLPVHSSRKKADELMRMYLTDIAMRRG
jgi:hypothetical protein